ncbi:hsp70 family protein, partial [Chlamydia psittaci 84-8471/1]
KKYARLLKKMLLPRKSKKLLMNLVVICKRSEKPCSRNPHQLQQTLKVGLTSIQKI